MADKWASLIDQFVNITGTSKKIAKSILEACNGNLEMAIEMHLDSDSSTQAGPSSADVGATSAIDSEDNVRAPIPQTRGILVEEPYHNFRGRRRTSKSVFDGFRDFQAEAMQQEMEASGESGRTRSRPGATKKRKTLQDLFRPPIDLLHKGTFETGKTTGQQLNKWLMVNVQDIKEFKCQQLNRDVWSNEAVRNIVQEHFVLWQVYRDSDEGDRYSQFYHVASFPYIAILDPRTGEKMVEWGHVDAQSFCENATEFVLQHPYLENDSPPLKKRKKESIVDASEDSQLEAAIAASLQYSKCQETNASASENSSSEGEMGFTDSDSEHKETATRLQDKDSAAVASNSQSSNGKAGRSSDCGENSPSRKPLSTFSSTSSETSCTRGMVTAGEGSSSLQSTVDTRNTGVETPQTVDQGPVCTIMVRFPSGARKQVSLNALLPLMALIDFIQKEGYPSEHFELLTNFPRRRLTDMDFGTSLQSAGLFPQDTVFVQER